ncbi:MAG: cytochrome c-type biogenesis protein CcmH, partial [Gemmatimonas sp.]
MNRRAFLVVGGRSVVAIAVTTVASAATTRFLGAQSGSQSAASNVEMTADAYKPVRRPPKPGGTPQMDKAAVEAFERNLACPCPCTLDVYTCRTTDFNCGISPAVHGDIDVLVNGGYSADEIMTAMTDTYGDFILMTPRKQGFNLLAWFAPFTALGVGALGVGVLLRSWRRNANAAAATRAATLRRDLTVDGAGTDATPEELARLQTALR